MSSQTASINVPSEPKTNTFKPYVPDAAELTELSFSAVALGTVLGIIFGASSLYLFSRLA